MPIAKHIKVELVQWLKFRKPGDRIILAFSGHGIQLGKVAYFCPADIDLRKPETMVSFATIYELMKLCPAEVKLLITDACRTNPFAPKTRDIIPGLESVTRPQAIPPPGGIAALFACAAGQAAFEDKRLGTGKPPGHGVFFHFLIEAFRGAADATSEDCVNIQISDSGRQVCRALRQTSASSSRRTCRPTDHGNPHPFRLLAAAARRKDWHHLSAAPEIRKRQEPRERLHAL